MDEWQKDWLYKVEVTRFGQTEEFFLNCGATMAVEGSALVTLTHEPAKMAEIKKTIDGLHQRIRQQSEVIERTNSPRGAAKALLEHVIYYSLEERLGTEGADLFIRELSLIADGKGKYGALLDALHEDE